MARITTLKVSCIDLFCGAGGLTHGFVLEGFPVVAGFDMDPSCRFPYENNNSAKFFERDITTIRAQELINLFDGAEVKILVGCAPCQPFSTYSQRYSVRENSEWGLMYEFARLSKSVKPDIISMENVPTVAKHKVFYEFIDLLNRSGYQVWHDVIDSSLYGVPQTRKRMVLLASRYGNIKIISPTHDKAKTVREAIGHLRDLEAGKSDSKDKLHAASTLTKINLQRIKASTPGGTWRDWPKQLVATCHLSRSGKTYPGVYGRMEWGKPAPTMTTQCYGYGNGRFGHPEQHRAISLREAAILQSFPRNYAFMQKGMRVNFKVLGRLIGNAVPVSLARAIARSIKIHLASLRIR